MARKKKADEIEQPTRKRGVSWVDETVHCASCNIGRRRCEMTLWKNKTEQIEGVGVVIKERYLCSPCANEKGI